MSPHPQVERSYATMRRVVLRWRQSGVCDPFVAWRDWVRQRAAQRERQRRKEAVLHRAGL